MKVELREKLLHKRNQLEEYEIQAISNQIYKNITELGVFQRASMVHCYLSLPKEVSTGLIINDLLEESKNVVVPRVIKGSNKMEHILLSTQEQLARNPWGILEPLGGNQIPIKLLDMVIVPMVGGDREGNRLGYGKGFYDQFLAEVECYKIGLVPEICLVDRLPIEPHDVKLDMIVTEHSVIT
ncbi:MAG: 5-formyltetrahydrofolate cyclo-ligase [Balneolales bacterium]